MSAAFAPVILGILLCILGHLNRKGNISSVHWYHRSRITEENKLPFGRLIGSGTLIIGLSTIALGGLSFLAEITQIEIFTIIGAVIALVGILIGLSMSLYAMFKYNRGIF